MLYQRSAAERSAPTFLVPDETFSQFQGTLAAEVHSESFVVHEILKLPERENPGLQLQAKQHVFPPFSCLLPKVQNPVPIRANMAPCSRCNISFVPFEGTNFGLALRPSRCKSVKDRGWVIR
jgi:hypothetical protein